MVVRRHRIQTVTLHPVVPSKCVEHFEIANTHRCVTLSQARIERCIAGRVEFAINTKRAVKTEQRTGLQRLTKHIEHLLDRLNTHDVSRVGRERRIESSVTGIVVTHVQFEWWQYVAELGVRDPRPYPGTVLRNVAWLPLKVRKLIRKHHRVLSGARANLEHLTTTHKIVTQYL